MRLFCRIILGVLEDLHILALFFQVRGNGKDTRNLNLLNMMGNLGKI